MRLSIPLLAGFCIASITNGAAAFDESDIIKVRALNQCEACDLREAELSNANLRRGVLIS